VTVVFPEPVAILQGAGILHTLRPSCRRLVRRVVLLGVKEAFFSTLARPLFLLITRRKNNRWASPFAELGFLALLNVQ
jgi:hypothetical protein